VSENEPNADPDGTAEARRVDLGAPTMSDPRAHDERERATPRPDLDERESNIRATRRPAGPPRPPAPDEDVEGAGDGEPPQNPTDPADLA